MRERGGALTTAVARCRLSDQSGELMALGCWFGDNGDGTVRASNPLKKADEHAADLNHFGEASIAFLTLHQSGVSAELQVILQL